MYWGSYLISASRASLDSGRTLILIISPPQLRYILLSALVENCGPSIHTTHFSVWRSIAPSGFFFLSASLTLCSNHPTNFVLNGSPNPTCATVDFKSSKKLAGRMPFVLSIIWSGMTKSPGLISSRREPTAEKANIVDTPRDLRAAIFALEGTLEGAMEWLIPCRAMKAICWPDGSAAMDIGDEGYPHGWGEV